MTDCAEAGRWRWGCAVVAPASNFHPWNGHDLARLDVPAVSEVTAQVGAHRVLQVVGAVGVAPQDEIAFEVVQRQHAAGLELVGPADLVPAEGDGERCTGHLAPPLGADEFAGTSLVEN
jgi:hypothetical protein